MLLLMITVRRLTTGHLQCAIFIKSSPNGPDTDTSGRLIMHYHLYLRTFQNT